MIDAAGVAQGHAVLDVACGTGVVANGAAGRVGASGSVTGVDNNPAMIAVAAERSAARGALAAGRCAGPAVR